MGSMHVNGMRLMTADRGCSKQGVVADVVVKASVIAAAARGSRCSWMVSSKALVHRSLNTIRSSCRLENVESKERKFIITESLVEMDLSALLLPEAS